MKEFILDRPFILRPTIRKPYFDLLEFLIIGSSFVIFPATLFILYDTYFIALEKSTPRDTSMFLWWVFVLIFVTIVPIFYLIRWRAFSIAFDTASNGESESKKECLKLIEHLDVRIITPSVCSVLLFIIFTCMLTFLVETNIPFHILCFFELSSLILGPILRIYTSTIQKILKGLNTYYQY